ncbi:hypothetical protein QQS21_011289 [Conoideocrella luteorostrata]|uniref:Uncharacterized protein n=1 Tax=Conoideocrella luteorostrata TaxID=1105319 RepID=A0AAJ0CFQ2_9HYPO|nr:hypothetical protein QQS21_011289 [Conoideocrella luteorostrata]
MASTANIAKRSISERSIRVLVSPTPITFGERRSVLQVLEQYGPVEVFKMTSGYHGNFVSVTREATTASRLVACSPLTYQVPVPRIKTDIHTADLGDDEGSNGFNTYRPSIINSSDELRRRDSSASENGAGPSGEQRQFKLEIFPAPDYKHKFAMSGSPLYHSWPEAYRKNKSFVAATLKQSLPQTIQATGLAHWLPDTGANNASKTDRKSERLQLKSWLPSKMKV